MSSRLFVLVAGLLVNVASVSAFADNCMPLQDEATCTATFRDAAGQSTNQVVNFTVYSSTYFCDGKPNKFYSKDFKLGSDYVGVVFADWESVRLSVYQSSDTAKLSPLGNMYSARSRGEDTHDSTQALSVGLPNGQFAQITCTAVVNSY